MRIKLRTTIVTTREDWSVAVIELLGDFLREQKDGLGTALFAVAAGGRAWACHILLGVSNPPMC